MSAVASTPRPPFWATFVATAGGAGFSPIAPGTAGTLVAVPLAWGLAQAGTAAYLLGLVVVTVLGTMAAEVYCRVTNKDDNQQIVVDEVAGYLVTLALVTRTPIYLGLGFFLFRLFDIWKPWPVRWADEKISGGFGVMADDLLAGVYGALVLVVLSWWAPWHWLKN